MYVLSEVPGKAPSTFSFFFFISHHTLPSYLPLTTHHLIPLFASCLLPVLAAIAIRLTPLPTPPSPSARSFVLRLRHFTSLLLFLVLHTARNHHRYLRHYHHHQILLQPGQTAHVEPDMSSSPSHPRAAYFEEYNEDADKTIPETRQTANIAAKRSKPDISKLKGAQGGPDDASESGNSTVATPLGEGEQSGHEPEMANPPSLKIDTGAKAPKSKERNSKVKTPGTPKKAPKIALRRTESKGQDGQPSGTKKCDCEECQPAKAKRPAMTRKSARSSESHVIPPPLLRTKTEAPTPPSPLKSSGPQPIQIPIIQPAQVRPRPTTTQTYRTARPASFHAGTVPAEFLYTRPVYIERPLGSTVITGLPYPQPSFTPTKPWFVPPSLPTLPQLRREIPPMSPYPYERRPQPMPLLNGRPHPGQWVSDQPSYRRQPMPYGTSPIVEDPGQFIYPVPNLNPQPSPRHSFNQQRERPPPVHEEPFFYDDDYFPTMPPPRPDESLQQYRPSIRHAATTSTLHPVLHHTRGRRGEEIPAGPHRERSPRKASPEKREHASRPSLASRASGSSGHQRSSLHVVDRNATRVRPESSAAAKQNRRASYYGHESHKDLERKVEAYQALTVADAGHRGPELTLDSLKMIRKKTQNSETNSRNSAEGKRSREGSDVKPRSSTDRRGGSDVKSRTDTEGFTMRVPLGVNIDLKGGGVEGRTISLRQSGEGEGGMELSIGGRGRNSGSKNESSDRSLRRGSYIEDGGAREMEYSRSLSQVAQADGDVENVAERERKVAGSRSRRSSRVGYRETRGFF